MVLNTAEGSTARRRVQCFEGSAFVQGSRGIHVAGVHIRGLVGLVKIFGLTAVTGYGSRPRCRISGMPREMMSKTRGVISSGKSRRLSPRRVFRSIPKLDKISRTESCSQSTTSCRCERGENGSS